MNLKKKNKEIIKHFYFIAALSAFLLISVVVLLSKTSNKENFNFKTITTNCDEFEITGNLSYDRVSSAIYLSSINYCGGNDKNVYESISSNLYEKINDNANILGSGQTLNKIRLENYLKEIAFYFYDYPQKCLEYTDKSLYLEVNAKVNGETTIYNIPLHLNSSCPR